MASSTEEKNESELPSFLDSQKPRGFKAPATPDVLHDRFRILVQQAIPELDHELAKAYAAADNINTERKMYAMVLDRSMPYRSKAAETLSVVNTPYIQSIYAQGSVLLSSTNQWHQVVFLDLPQAPKLSDLRAAGKKMHEHQVIDKILPALLGALIQLRDKELVHGSLNLSTVFNGEQAFIAEPVTAPAGYFQHYLYEPLERLMADQNARGVGDEKVDVYAAAVIAFELIYGIDHLHKMSRGEFIERALDIGTYHLFTLNLDLSDNMADFFRGAMSDNLEERWDVEHFQNWLGGKRYNMITPPTPRDATRSIEFLDKEYYSKRALAHTFHTQWRTTIKDVRELKLDRWFEMSMHQPEMASRVERILRIGGSGSSEKTNVDMLTRLISLLDPTGPIRTPHYSLRAEGLGILLADLFRNDLPTETHEVMDLLEADIPNYWAYLTEHTKPHDLAQILWRAQRIRPFLKMRALGFGIERVLYELNPDLPCQSTLIKHFNALSIPDVLQALDSLAASMAKDSSLMDRHIIAFLACKLDLGKEIKIQDVAPVAGLASNQELVALRIIGRAQQKHEKDRHVGLATWTAIRVETMLTYIHNRTLRTKLISKLKPAAASGHINEVLSILINREIINADQSGFHKALEQHQQSQKMIVELTNPKLLQRLSLQLGSRISTIVGYMILVSSFYYVAAILSGD